MYIFYLIINNNFIENKVDKCTLLWYTLITTREKIKIYQGENHL